MNDNQPPEHTTPELSIIVPLYNEEANLPRVPVEIAAALEADGIDYELVLVENGSADGTGRVLDEMSRANPRIQVVRVSRNEGYGWGVIHGLGAARGEFSGFMGGDGQIRAEDVVRVYRLLRQEGCDLAKVRRVERHDGFKRRVVTTLCNLLFPLLFPVRTRDINGTPKIGRTEMLRSLRLRSKDWFIDAEVMIKLGRRRARIAEVPVEFLARGRGASNVRWTSIVEFLVNILRALFSGKGDPA